MTNGIRARPVAVLLSVAAIVSLGSLAAGSALAMGFPYVDKNCEFQTTYTAAPRRAVTLSSNATELMLELGLEDHMVGTSYLGRQPIGPQYKAAYDRIPVLSPDIPTTEQLLNVNADFVYAGYPDAYGTTYHTRDQLHALGIKTRLNTEGCNAGPVTFDTLYEELRSVASIFGVPERADASIAKIAARLGAVQAKLKGSQPIKVFAYNGGEDAPGSTLGNSMLTEVIRQAGGINIFADIPGRWGKVSWEQIAERAPAYIVVYHHLDQSAQAHIEILNRNPTIKNVPAIKNQKFVVISSVLAQPGPRSIEAVEALAAAFHPDLMATR